MIFAGIGQDHGDVPKRNGRFIVSEESLTRVEDVLRMDFLVLFPAWHGQRAKRNDEEGSWMVIELKKAMSIEKELKQISGKACNLFHVITAATRAVADNYEVRLYKRDPNDNTQFLRDSNGGYVIDTEKSGGKSALTLYHTLMSPIIFKFT